MRKDWDIHITDVDGDVLRGMVWSNGDVTIGIADKNAVPAQEAVILLTSEQAKQLRKFLKNKKS